MSRATRFGLWLGATFKVFTCWAAVHIALVADEEPRWMRVLAVVMFVILVREARMAAWLNHRLKTQKVA